jgi:hypothetical protein
MKNLRCCFYSTLFLVGLFFGPVANADTDLLNLSAHSEGVALPYGENVVVAQDEHSGVKWVAGNGGQGRLKFPVNLSGDFELFIKVYVYNHYTNNEVKTVFLTSDEYQIKLSFQKHENVKLEVGKDRASDESKAWKKGTTNTLKLSVKGNVAKLYVNDVFSQKLTLKPDLIYTLLLFNGLINKDHLYELKIGGSVGATPTPISSGGECGTTTSGDAPHANYDPSKGELHVPFVDVPGAFGGVQTYEIYLIQKPMGFTFDLDMNRVKPR